ncbi:hypothetical protein EFK50_05025 [Nocardioides marmoriginsengisoli]|uniref:Uncharacterized protein n=1 Tax=Nocardioides marmoriginsengisoli TaxID=661483 RepID=A0A3N0CPC2_9ACTN|nr:choice-of-anchor P family protein [Nocardioides marmoriginsengisoli]RNL65324.1 hypothetical protein EFK50_05025 [Nocardioides marmoriginsengisoli]
MTCGECTNDHKGEKTLYDKTVARRIETASRRAKRTVASAAVLGLLSIGGAASVMPAQAADYSGWSTYAQATPLRIELREPAIPIPSDPQLELNFSYTKVGSTSGPIGSARASALWPGDAVGEGLKTFGEQLGLPGALTDGGYPVQVNAMSPGDTAAATQEFFPGMTGKVTTSPKKAVAKVGYGTAGDVDPGGDGTGTKPKTPLELLQSGDLSALSGLLAGASTAGPGETPSTSPLGLLSLLIKAGGMESISSTTYDEEGDSVIATATSRLGSIGLLGGIVKLDGVEVITTVTSNLAKGAVISRKVTMGALSIAGNKFAMTGDGIEAMGKVNPIPGLPDAPAAALKALGISIDLGKATQSKTGPAGSVTAEALRITIKTAPLLSKLPKLPLGQLMEKFPDLPGQAGILKGLIIALGDATPQLDIVLGQATSRAETVAGIDPGPTVTPPTTGGPTTETPGGTDGGPGIDSGPMPGELPPVQAGGEQPSVTTPVVPRNATSGLPPLDKLPTWLVLLGLAIGGGLGWYIFRSGSLLFGGAVTCAHGLRAGIPDLRKV